MIDFKDEFMRLCSYPRYWSAEKSLLALQGFYYSGIDLDVVCAFCQAILNLRLVDIEQVRGRHEDDKCRHGNLEGNEGLGSVNNYKCEKSRLCSFLMNKWQYPVDPNGLASSGFYWTGYFDQVRCEFCGLEVQDWEIGDTGEDAHLTFSPECPFVSGQQVQNVPLKLKNPDERIGRHFFQQRTQVETMKLSTSGEMDAELDEAITPSLRPVFPGFAAPAIRLKSFSLWPKGLNMQPGPLADAGFFYTGKGDRVMCFQCGGGLTNWSENLSPWTEHALYFPTCTYVGVIKGRKFIQQVQEEMQLASSFSMEDKEDVENCKMNNHNSSLSDCSSGKKTEDDSMLCKLCRDSEIRTVSLPCGHMTCCSRCAPRLENCLLCGKNVATNLNIFL